MTPDQRDRVVLHTGTLLAAIRAYDDKSSMYWLEPTTTAARVARDHALAIRTYYLGMGDMVSAEAWLGMADKWLCVLR